MNKFIESIYYYCSEDAVAILKLIGTRVSVDTVSTHYQFTNNLIIKNIAACPILYSLTISIKHCNTLCFHSVITSIYQWHSKFPGWWIEFGKVTKKRLFISIKLSISTIWLEWIVVYKIKYIRLSVNLFIFNVRHVPSTYTRSPYSSSSNLYLYWTLIYLKY